MNKQLKIILSFIIITALLAGVAYNFDSKRAQQKKIETLLRLDQDISSLEENYISEIKLLTNLSSETDNKMREYQNTQDFTLKHKLFQEIVTLSARDSAGSDKSNPLLIKQLDKLAGLSNRHEIMMGKRAEIELR